VKVINGLGERWLCPDCGRIIDKPPFRVRGTEPDYRGMAVGYYHAWACDRPMVRCVVILGGAS